MRDGDKVARTRLRERSGSPLTCQRPPYNFFRSRLVLRLETAEDPRKKAAWLPRNPDLPTKPEAERID
jgi:hypothetical protein